MDLLELLLAIAVWVVFSILGWRKKAARQQPVDDGSGWPEWEALDEPEAVPEPAAPPVAEEEPSRPAAPTDLRDLIRQIKKGLAPPVERSKPPPGPEPARPASLEPPPPPDLPELPELPQPAMVSASPRARRAWLARELTSGSDSLARAIVLREVLGPPVALRTSGEPDRWGT